MLNQNSFTCQSPISLLFLFRQSMILGFLEGCLAVFMEFCQALVASICQYSNMIRNVAAILLEKLKVVFASIGKGCCHNFSSPWVSDQLRFLGMSPLFAAVVLFLAFFGRSITCSLASTSTTSKIVLPGWSAFLPGKRNFPERTSASSTFWIVRQMVAALTP